MNNRLLALGILVLAAVFSACGGSAGASSTSASTGKPDLIVVPDASGSFCRIDRNTGELTITIKNQGTAEAGFSRTGVDFSNTNMPGLKGPNSQSVFTHSLAAGESVDLTVNLLKSPKGDTYTFPGFLVIVADADQQVAESNEDNNGGDDPNCG